MTISCTEALCEKCFRKETEIVRKLRANTKRRQQQRATTVIHFDKYLLARVRVSVGRVGVYS